MLCATWPPMHGSGRALHWTPTSDTPPDPPGRSPQLRVGSSRETHAIDVARRPDAGGASSAGPSGTARTAGWTVRNCDIGHDVHTPRLIRDVSWPRRAGPPGGQTRHGPGEPRLSVAWHRAETSRGGARSADKHSLRGPGTGAGPRGVDIMCDSTDEAACRPGPWVERPGRPGAGIPGLRSRCRRSRVGSAPSDIATIPTNTRAPHQRAT